MVDETRKHGGWKWWKPEKTQGAQLKGLSPSDQVWAWWMKPEKIEDKWPVQPVVDVHHQVDVSLCHLVIQSCQVVELVMISKRFNILAHFREMIWSLHWWSLFGFWILWAFICIQIPLLSSYHPPSGIQVSAGARGRRSPTETSVPPCPIWL